MMNDTERFLLTAPVDAMYSQRLKEAKTEDIDSAWTSMIKENFPEDEKRIALCDLELTNRGA